MKNVFLKGAMLVLSLAFASCQPGPKSKVNWLPYSQAALDQAKQNSKPVVIDFYADWCAPCHELDEKTYSDPRVAAKLSEFEIMKADLTDSESAESGKVMEKFELVGVPVIAFFDAKGNEIKEARVSGFISADEMLKKLDCVLSVSEGKAAPGTCV